MMLLISGIEEHVVIGIRLKVFRAVNDCRSHWLFAFRRGSLCGGGFGFGNRNQFSFAIFLHTFGFLFGRLFMMDALLVANKMGFVFKCLQQKYDQ